MRSDSGEQSAEMLVLFKHFSDKYLKYMNFCTYLHIELYPFILLVNQHCTLCLVCTYRLVDIAFYQECFSVLLRAKSSLNLTSSSGIIESLFKILYAPSIFHRLLHLCHQQFTIGRLSNGRTLLVYSWASPLWSEDIPRFNFKRLFE